MASALMTLGVASATCILARTQDILVIAKSKGQRTPAEAERIERGLLKSLILDFSVFVPASTFVVLATIAPMLPKGWVGSDARDGLLGVLAYAFPLLSFKKAVTVWVMRSLKSFYEVLSETERAQLDGAVEAKTQDLEGGGRGV
jgi:hypothetical protein